MSNSATRIPALTRPLPAPQQRPLTPTDARARLRLRQALLPHLPWTAERTHRLAAEMLQVAAEVTDRDHIEGEKVIWHMSQGRQRLRTNLSLQTLGRMWADHRDGWLLDLLIRATDNRVCVVHDALDYEVDLSDAAWERLTDLVPENCVRLACRLQDTEGTCAHEMPCQPHTISALSRSPKELPGLWHPVFSHRGGLNPASGWVLWALQSYGSLTRAELCRVLGAKPWVVSKSTRRLQELGIIGRAGWKHYLTGVVDLDRLARQLGLRTWAEQRTHIQKEMEQEKQRRATQRSNLRQQHRHRDPCTCDQASSTSSWSDEMKGSAQGRQPVTSPISWSGDSHPFFTPRHADSTPLRRPPSKGAFGAHRARPGPR